MKQLLLPIACVLLLQACSKDPASGVTSIISSSMDTVSISDAGMTYTYVRNSSQPLSCIIKKTSINSVFSLTLSPSATTLISLSIYSASGPVNSLGKYNVHPADSTNSSVKNNNKFTETFSGGEAYTVDSVFLNITEASGKTVVGTFEMFVHNVNKKKTITGSINCHNANIN